MQLSGITTMYESIILLFKTRLVGGLMSVKRLYVVSCRNIFKIGKCVLKHLQTVVIFFFFRDLCFYKPPREVHLQMLEATIKLE